jgi:hypothetical protein
MPENQYHERTKNWRIACEGVLFHDGDIVELGEKAEAAEDGG